MGLIAYRTFDYIWHLDFQVVYMSDLAQQVRCYVANSNTVDTNIFEGTPLQICVSWLMLPEDRSD